MSATTTIDPTALLARCADADQGWTAPVVTLSTDTVRALVAAYIAHRGCVA